MKRFFTLFYKTIVFVTLILFSNSLLAQDPYIVTTEGVGKYGYIEKDGVTYIRLNANTHWTQEMAARWYVGQEYVYYTGNYGDKNFSNYEASTSNYSASNFGSNFVEGNTAYVSVLRKSNGGGGSWSPCVNNCTGYNERLFKILDVNTNNAPTLATSLVSSPSGSQNLVGSFIISNGSSTGISLKRLWLHNKGTAQEVSDIPNDGIKIYWEPVNGTETYSGSESNAILYGNYGGNSASNAEWGNDDLSSNSIAIPSGGLRIYVVISSISSGYTAGRNINFEIINDGISLSPKNNTNFDLMRINATDVGSSIVLSTELTSFSGKKLTSTNELSWITSLEKDNAQFNIQRSTNNQSWQTIGTVKATNNPSGAKYNFTDDAPLSTINYYRLQMVSTDGKIDYSKVVSVSGKEGKQALSVYPNPVKAELNVLTDGTTEGISIYDMTGKIVRQYNDNRSKVNVQDLPNGIYFVRLLDKNGLVGEAVRFVKQ